eukprot:scaffold181160_cov48-Prasinocladus_malaysianus.AAC.1
MQLSPLPNIPVYYFGYRTWAHYRAWQGARSLHEVIVDIDRKQLLGLREKIIGMQAGGHKLAKGSWAEDLVSLSSRYQTIICSGPCVDGNVPDLVELSRKVVFTKSKELEEILQPEE